MEITKFSSIQKSLVIAIFFFSQIMAQSNGTHEKAAKIFIQSEPNAAVILIDSTFIGMTPLHFEIDNLNPITITSMKEGFITQSNVLSLNELQDTSIFVRLLRPTSLVINSEPDSAFVFVDDNYVGASPLTLFNIASDTLHIALRKRDYELWTGAIIPAENNKNEMIGKLVKWATNVSVLAESDSDLVYFDNKLISRGTIIEYSATTGFHTLRVINQNSGRQAELELNLANNINIFFRSTLGYHSITKALLTMVAPGAVHMYDGDYKTGSLLLFGSGLAAYFTYKTNQEYKNRLDNYNLAFADYINAPTEIEAQRRHENVSSSKSYLDKYDTRRTIAMAIFSSIYLYSAVDAFMNHILSDNIEIITQADIFNRSVETKFKIKF